ncbi:hypothetical protein E7T06_18855 [Deinococcus sp. Arct2-2]|uniref:winged helix-turn-helix domain-containing protein n=1 Tax=Deinococcus sp. Arct2-2 TaxID=2568653 RepID=UPI0011393BDB|nr:winged helix-turn-helix domain-containing protein [Deinococcus sp. Arct2-2]THF67936.1 hypothetical protein E7T06_18855 [Deinococcus sp. Arct2-2]
MALLQAGPDPHLYPDQRWTCPRAREVIGMKFDVWYHVDHLIRLLHAWGTLNHGLTSMLKRVDTAVYSVIRDVAQDLPWRAGDRSFGLSNGGVSLAFDQYNQALVPATVRANLKAVEGLITSGAVTVPAK